MPHSNDHHLWDLVKRRCTPLGQCAPSTRMAGGFIEAQFAHTLDLHELTLAQAYTETRAFIACARAAGRKEVTIVTGRSGAIRQEFPTWTDLHPEVRRATTTNGDGAFVLRLKPR